MLLLYLRAAFFYESQQLWFSYLRKTDTYNKYGINITRRIQGLNCPQHGPRNKGTEMCLT